MLVTCIEFYNEIFVIIHSMKFCCYKIVATEALFHNGMFVFKAELP